MNRAISTFTYNVLVRCSWLQRRRYTVWLWRVISRLSGIVGSGIVSTTIHGKRVDVPFGYPYPVITRTISTFNAPLIELMFERHRAKNARVNVIDVGASVGDTALLLLANCPDMIGRIYCVEGEEEFFRLLKKNIGRYRNVTMYCAMLSSETGSAKKLVRIHPGTASAVGAGTIPTTSLDTLINGEGIAEVDILKIDVDGYDGRVLKGAAGLLRKNKPDIFFEWHPGLCLKAGNAPTEHFNVLSKEGYTSFIFFTKLGEFSHFMNGFDRKAVEHLIGYCLDPEAPEDWHYDVVALPAKSSISPSALAVGRFARWKISPF